jgi:hypothetical protein
MLVGLQNVDILIREVRGGYEEALGFTIDRLDELEKVRARMAGKIDPRDLEIYERVVRKYDVVSAVVPVRDKNCLGCFMDLPTSATKLGPDTDSLLICENCGRILYWV